MALIVPGELELVNVPINGEEVVGPSYTYRKSKLDSTPKDENVKRNLLPATDGVNVLIKLSLFP